MQIERTFDDLIDYLRQLRDHGDSGSLLRVAIAQSKNDIFLGNSNGQLSLDFGLSGIRGWLLGRRFKHYCVLHRLPTHREKWGTLKVLRAAVGVNEFEIARHVSRAFESLYSKVPGSYFIQLEAVGWASSAEAPSPESP